AISAPVVFVAALAHFHAEQLLGQADSAEGVARRTEDRADLGRPLPETFQMVLAMVEDHAAIGMIDTVIEIVAELATTDSLADDLCDRGGGRGDQKPPGFSKNFDGCWKKAVQLSIDRLGRAFERGEGIIVGGRDPTADVEQLELKAAALGFGEDSGGQVQRLDIVLHIGALAADVEAQPLDIELVV